MGLRDWDIDLARELCSDPDTGAECSTTYGRKIATVRFGQGFFGHSPETQRYYCVHELLHCHTAPLATALCNVHGAVGGDAYAILKGTHEDAMEWAVDGIGVAFAKLLPLPPTEDNADVPANVVQIPKRVAA